MVGKESRDRKQGEEGDKPVGKLVKCIGELCFDENTGEVVLDISRTGEGQCPQSVKDRYLLAMARRGIKVKLAADKIDTSQ